MQSPVERRAEVEVAQGRWARSLWAMLWGRVRERWWERQWARRWRRGVEEVEAAAEVVVAVGRVEEAVER